jgi:type IV/VI secretion system ImpK/VasF family protein
MKNLLWSSVYDLVQEVDTVLSRAERFNEGAGGSAPADAEAAAASPKKKAAFFKAYVATDDLVEVRAKLRAKLDVLKADLAEELTERESYLVLFPLVVLFDELIQNRFLTGGQSGSWPSLQTELFKIDNGGEVFFDTLDDLLRKPDTLTFVFEVFYLCLSHGFKGRYADNLAKVNEYKHKLEARIPQPIVPRRALEAGATNVFSFGTLPVARYAAVVALLVLVYAAFRIVAEYSWA